MNKVIKMLRINRMKLCSVCKGEVKPYKKGGYPKTCSKDCLSKMRTINARRAIKQGRIKAFSLADRKR